MTSRAETFSKSATAHQPNKQETPPEAPPEKGWDPDPVLSARQNGERFNPKTWVFTEEEAEEFAFPGNRRARPHEGTIDRPIRMTFGDQWITDNGEW